MVAPEVWRQEGWPWWISALLGLIRGRRRQSSRFDCEVRLNRSGIQVLAAWAIGDVFEPAEPSLVLERHEPRSAVTLDQQVGVVSPLLRRRALRLGIDREVQGAASAGAHRSHPDGRDLSAKELHVAEVDRKEALDHGALRSGQVSDLAYARISFRGRAKFPQISARGTSCRRLPLPSVRKALSAGARDRAGPVRPPLTSPHSRRPARAAVRDWVPRRRRRGSLVADPIGAASSKGSASSCANGQQRSPACACINLDGGGSTQQGLPEVLKAFGCRC